MVLKTIITVAESRLIVVLVLFFSSCYIILWSLKKMLCHCLKLLLLCSTKIMVMNKSKKVERK